MGDNDPNSQPRRISPGGETRNKRNLLALAFALVKPVSANWEIPNSNFAATTILF